MEDSLKHHNTENLLNQLRICIANDYLPSDNCYIILWHIYKQLIKTGESSINFRQLIGSSEVLKKDLIPMLVAVNDSKILSVLIKVLTNLITPIECIILDTKQHVNRFEHSNVIKLKQLLLKSKIWWTDSRSIKRIIQIIKKYIEELSKPLGCFSIYAVPIISDCLLLIRNILIVDDDQCQRRMLLILFCEQFGETLMVLIHNSLRRKWAAQVIELIALVFQNDEVAAKMNTIIINYSKNNMASYYPDNLREFNYMKQQGHIILDDLGYNLRIHAVKDEVERQFLFRESICNLQSDSSNTEREVNTSGIQPREIPHKLKSDDGTRHNATIVDAVNKNTDTLRKKKYTKKLPKNMLKTLPTRDEESMDRNIVFLQLRKFAIHFLQNGFSTLVDEVYSILISNTQHNIDLSHFFWLLIYLCRFCKLNRIELKMIRGIVSIKMIKNMAYEGYKIAKQLSMAEQQKSDDVQIYVRQLYLVVMAIKEVVETIELYRKISVTPLTNIDLLQDLECNNSPESTTWKEDIKSLFSMLIHFYNSDLQTFEYLLDLIITNHKLILLLDNLDYWTSNDTTEHFKRFATADIMYKYGTVLQNYTKNDELVNDAILTLIRHVFGDCELNSVILQPIILETLLKITENDYNPCKKWRDLIERVLNLSKFRAICSAYAESRITRKIQKKI